MFHAEKFDPAEWVRLFKEAGAGYVFPVAEHHDGFQMYKSELSHWNSAEVGPKRDVLGELKAEIEKQGLTFCTSSHRAEHWFFLGHGKEFDSDIKEPLQKEICTGRPCRNRMQKISTESRIRQKNFK